jgi:hypothetical protein
VKQCPNLTGTLRLCGILLGWTTILIFQVSFEWTEWLCREFCCISLDPVAPCRWILLLMFFLSNKVKVYVLGQVYQLIFSSVRGQTRNRKTLEAMWRLPFSWKVVFSNRPRLKWIIPQSSQRALLQSSSTYQCFWYNEIQLLGKCRGFISSKCHNGENHVAKGTFITAPILCCWKEPEASKASYEAQFSFLSFFLSFFPFTNHLTPNPTP